MADIRCTAPSAIDDYDETFFVQFLRIHVEKDDHLPATLPGAGALFPPPNSAKRAGKSADALAKEIRDLLARPKPQALQFTRKFDVLRQLAAGGAVVGGRRLHKGDVDWFVGLQFRQTWKQTDMGAGRLVAAVPVGVHPGVKRIDLKIWNKSVETTKDTISTESLYTTEITSSDKWSLAAKKLFATETASDVNPSATINSIGVSVPGTVGVNASGSLGVSGSFSSNVKDQAESTSDYIAEQTSKAASSLKSARTIEVTTQRESGSERTVSETLTNPNRGSTLNYLFWEILETFEIETRLDRIDPYLSVPLPVNSVVSRPWLLQHECEIRPHLPCVKLAAGFDAAKESLKLEAQIAALDAQIAPAKDTPARTRAADKMVTAAEALVVVYDTLAQANPANGRIGAWEYWGLVGIVAGNDLKRGLDAFRTAMPQGADPAPADVREALDDLFKAIGSVDDVFTRVGAAVASFMGFTALLGCGLVPPLGMAVVILVTGLAIAADAAGLDLVPDDHGLQDAVRNAKRALGDWRTASSAPPAGKDASEGFNPELRASLAREGLANRKIEADIETQRLSAHVREEIYKYHHAIWAGFSASRIAQLLRGAGVDPSLVELRFAGFDLDRAYLRVTDIARLEREKLKWRDFVTSTLAAKPAPAKRVMRLPAPGAWAEAVRGKCDALDTFVSRHREVDIAIREALLDQRKAEAKQASAEADRLAARVSAGVLDDPTPYRRADRVEIEVEAAEEAPTVNPLAHPPSP